MKVTPTLSKIRLARLKTLLSNSADKISWKSVLIIGIRPFLRDFCVGHHRSCPLRCGLWLVRMGGSSGSR